MLDWSRPSRSRRSTSSVADAGSGWPERNTQRPCSFLKGPVPRTGRSVICSPALSISSASPGDKCSSWRNGLGITTRPALSITRRVGIIGAQLWVDLSVHTILVKSVVRANATLPRLFTTITANRPNKINNIRIFPSTPNVYSQRKCHLNSVLKPLAATAPNPVPITPEWNSHPPAASNPSPIVPKTNPPAPDRRVWLA